MAEMNHFVFSTSVNSVWRTEIFFKSELIDAVKQRKGLCVDKTTGVMSDLLARSLVVDSQNIYMSGRIKKNSVTVNSASLQSVKDTSSSREFNEFIKSNEDILATVSRISGIEEILKKTPVNSTEDLINIVVSAAKDGLVGQAKEKIDDKFLKQHIEIAKMLATDAGNLKKMVNNLPELVDVLTIDSSMLLDYGRKQLAEKASSLFDEDHPLADSSLYQNRSNVATFLLYNEDVVSEFKRLSDGASKSLRFISRIDEPSFKDISENFMADIAAGIVQTTVYNSDFMKDNLPLSEMVVFGEQVKDMPTMSVYLQKHPEFGLGNITEDLFNLDSILSSLLTEQATGVLQQNNPFSLETLQKETGLARALVSSSLLRGQVVKDRDKIMSILEPSSYSTSFSDSFLKALSASYSADENSSSRFVEVNV